MAYWVSEGDFFVLSLAPIFDMLIQTLDKQSRKWLIDK